MKFVKSMLLGKLLLAALVSIAQAAPVLISTIPLWNGTSNTGDFGASGFSSWGQSVLAPAGTNRLLDFTFVVSDARQSTTPRPITGLIPNPVPVKFQSHVVRFDMNTRTLIGPVLYSSTEQTVPLTDNLSFVQYNFAPDIEVVPGATYLLFLFANNYDLQIPDDSRLRLATTGFVYADGGEANGINANSDFNGLFANGAWFGGFTMSPDLAFSATFDNVPVTTPVSEPATLLIMSTALAAVTLGKRRRSAAMRMKHHQAGTPAAIQS